MKKTEQQVLDEVRKISARGNNAEVKVDKDDNWVVYEVEKKKKKVG